MTRIYEIRNLQDIAELEPEQQVNFLTDLASWLSYVNNAPVPEGFKMDKSMMIWRDDGDYGVVHAVTVSVRHKDQGQ